MIDEIIKLIDSYWKFDNDQQHLSTWHDKQDLIEAVKEVKNCNTTAVSKSVEPVGRVTVCSHPREHRTYIGRNTLRCGLCGLEFE